MQKMPTATSYEEQKYNLNRIKETYKNCQITYTEQTKAAVIVAYRKKATVIHLCLSWLVISNVINKMVEGSNGL